MQTVHADVADVRRRITASVRPEVTPAPVQGCRATPTRPLTRGEEAGIAALMRDALGVRVALCGGGPITRFEVTTH